MTPSRKMTLTTLTILSLFQLTGSAEGGTRYRDLVFASATVTANVQYGSNLNIDGTTATLYLDLYAPANDTATLRPLVICIHGGSLIGGGRIDMSAFCTDFARRGYVAATIDYRLGIDAPKGVTTILEALLRGVQDTKAAVRFLRANAAAYGIDTSRIYLEGSSAGSMIAAHYAYWDQNEIPPDVNQTKWGNLEGASGTPGVSSAIDGIINYCGAIVNPSWINAGEVPVANFHGLLDTVVPPDSGISTDFGIELHGGVAISRAALNLGIYQQGAFFPTMGHGGNEDSLRVFGSNFLYTLMVLSSTAPQSFSSFALSINALRLFRYNTYPFLTSAMDPWGNRIILPQTMVQYSCQSNVGSIAPTGIFTPSDHADSGYVYAQFNNIKDSCYVRTFDFKYFVWRPKRMFTDTLRTLQLAIDTYSADSVKLNLPLSQFTFTSTAPSVGTVDATGTFTGLRSGNTQVIAACGTYRDTCFVTVEGARGLVSFDLLDNLAGWTFTGDNLDTLSVTLSTDQKSAGNASFMVKYRFIFDPQKLFMAYLNTNERVYGIPDSIYLDAMTDGQRHRLYYRFADADSNLFSAAGRKYMNSSAAFDMINTAMSGFGAVSGATQVTYPLTLRRIDIQLAGGAVQGDTVSGTMYLDNLRLKYPGLTLGVPGNSLLPVRLSLEQNYPNPFNPTTTIQYRLPSSATVTLRVFDLLGREVRTLVNERQNAGIHTVVLHAAGLSSGVYFYRIEAGAYRDTRKLVLLK